MCHNLGFQGDSRRYCKKIVFRGTELECCQDDSVNCSCFRKDKMKTQGLFDPCACTSQDECCTTELCLSVVKLKRR